MAEKESNETMRHVKMIVLAAIAALVLAAVGSASASASEPSIWQCGAARKSGKLYTGLYTNKTCSKEATTKEKEGGKTNKYEFEEWALGENTKTGKENWGKKGKVKELKAKGAKGERANLETSGVGGVYCTSTNLAKGAAFTGPKTAGKIIAVFSGCEFLEKYSCESEQAGVKPGEIQTFPLKAEIGYINKTEHLVGAALSPEGGTYLAQFHCANGLGLRVSGSVIGQVEKGVESPYNKFSTHLTLKFEQAASKQECEEGVDKACYFLEGDPVEHALETEIAPNWPETDWGAPNPSTEEVAVEGKGEELYLKA